MKEKSLSWKKNFYHERKIPIMREKSPSWKKNPYHERKIPIMKEKSLSWQKNPNHERKIPIMKEKSLSWKKNPYHERKIPIMREKSLSWKKNPWHERKIPIMKGFCHFNLYLPRVEIPSHFHRIDYIKIQGFFHGNCLEKHFWKNKKNICTLNWFSARANFLLKWFNTGFYQYCIF